MTTSSVRTWGKWVNVVLMPLAVAGCGAPDADEVVPERTATQRANVSPPVASFPSTAVRHWMTNFANAVRVDGVTAPVASRTYAYAAVSVYEALVHGMPGYRSLAGQLNGLDSLPQPDAGAEYDWPTVLAATMHRVQARDFFPDGTYQDGINVFPFIEFHEFVTVTLTGLGTLGPVQIGFRRVAGVPQDVIARSEGFGTELGNALRAWAISDGYLDDVRFSAFDPPNGPDKWVPTGFSDPAKVASPVEPHFGRLRPMVLTEGAECLADAPAAFSTDPSSEFYQQALAVYNTDQNLTIQQRDIALFWADGPGTAAPPGHWLLILNTLIRNQNMADAAVAHMLMAIAQYDAFITTWYTKYHYNLLRPETYIRRHIDPNWRPFMPTPQFPEYTSGHSGQSGAATMILADIFGDIPFTDTTKRRRGFGAPSYPSFTAAAEEVANSRLYGGIHYPMGNEAGLDVGHCTGQKVLERIQLQ
jgi:hypothetical protein